MPCFKKIKKTMIKQKISSDLIEQMGFDDQANGNDPNSILPVIDKMDELLSREQVLAIMEQQGCCKGGQRDKDCKAFALEHADKTLVEKLALLPNIQYMMAPWLNDDGTLTVEWGEGYQNGKHTGKTTCSCGIIKQLKQPFSVSDTFCGCCAGHFKHHYQTALGVKLKLKEIRSSPLNTNGEKPCSFTFEILE